ncbi:MAG: aminodeoxychorismate synthase component I, partial [Sphingomonadaceae bacterium]
MVPALDPTRPFALIWDSDRAQALLFQNPRGVVESADVAAAVPQLRAAVMAGDWLAGGIPYEAGFGLEPRLAGLARGETPLWFGRFGPPARLSPAETAELLAGFARPTAIGAPRPLVGEGEWKQAVSRCQALIAAGDIYQANLCFPAEVPVSGHPVALFARLFAPEAAPHAALVHDGRGRWWLSLSPERFFALEAGRLGARPMKGTAARPADPAADRAAAEALARDPKNRAENLMITDLIRHDLARVSVPGTVRVPALFAIESYPAVHQMTSSVTAALAPGLDALDVLAALFPCGSITGAPKIRAMEVIAELEPFPRGIYCGAIGWIAPGAESAALNVAIRTLALEQPGTARLGLGAGIITDSDSAAEWAECLAKARFLAPAAPRTLLETMRLEPGGTIPRLARHLDRLASSAARFGFALDRPALEARLSALAVDAPSRLRLALSAEGALALLLVLDQFPRNIFRGTPQVYATDAKALDLARGAIAAGHLSAFEPPMTRFFILPLTHAEDLGAQEEALALLDALGDADGLHW